MPENKTKSPAVLSNWQFWLLLSFLTLLILVLAVLACVPPVSRDALIHHLAIPQLHLNHGGMYEIPDKKHAYYPMNLDLLYIIPLYFKNDILAKYIHFAFALATAGMIFGHLKRRLNPSYALLGAGFFLSIPIIVRLSGIVYVDLGLVFFSWVTLLYILKWAESDFPRRHLIMAGIFCGLALGTKYNGLIILFITTALIPVVYVRLQPAGKKSSARALAPAFLFMFTALLVFSPWLIRNYAWTQNPVYPLYDNLISPGPPNPDKSPTTSHPIRYRQLLYNESWAEIALVPVRVFFQGQDGTPRYFDGRLNPFLLILPFFAFLFLREDSRILKTEKTVFAVFSILVILIVFFQTDIRARYVSPILPPLVILSMFGLDKLNRWLSKILSSGRDGVFWRQAAVIGLVVFMLALNIRYIQKRWTEVAPLKFISGEVSRDKYIQQRRPEYAAMQFANQNLADRHKILGIYAGKRGYYCEIPIMFDLYMLRDLATDIEHPSKITKKLKTKGITHLLINEPLFNRQAGGYSAPVKKSLARFFRTNVTKLFTRDGYSLYQLQ